MHKQFPIQSLKLNTHRLRLSSEEAVRGYKKRLAQAERRLGELDRLFIRIYEDNVAGKLSDERFALMSKTYEDEQAQLKVEIQTLQQEIEVQERQIENLEQFIQRVHKGACQRNLHRSA